MRILLAFLLLSLISGCASVPTGYGIDMGFQFEVRGETDKEDD